MTKKETKIKTETKGQRQKDKTRKDNTRQR